jgi:hypothetical protein
MQGIKKDSCKHLGKEKNIRATSREIQVKLIERWQFNS